MTDVRADTAASVWKVVVPDGSRVQEGDELFVLESMKMEIPVIAPQSGVVHVRVAEGDPVEGGHLLATID